jgi:dephospho-CoA kinase
MHLGLTGGGHGLRIEQRAELFSVNGWHCVESDACGAAFAGKRQRGHFRVRDRFGPNVVEGGKVNRASSARRCSTTRRRCDGWRNCCSRVRAQWQASIAAIPPSCGDSLLYEKNLENQFDLNVCVTAGLSTQLERLAKRGFSREQALARMARQLRWRRRKKRADVVISNNGTLDFTRMQVVHLLALLQP